MEHWLSLGVGVFLLAMVLYGHYKGFLRLIITFLALVMSVIVVQFAMPKVTEYLQNNTEVYKTFGESLLKMTDAESVMEDQYPSQQRDIIEQLKIPEQMKEALLENNNREIYKILRVEEFLDYVGTCLAGMIINLIGSALLFILVYIALRFLIHWLDLLARLPILHGMNQIAGAVLGGIQGLLMIWFFFWIIQICSEKSWTEMLLLQIKDSLWLTFLYENNLFNWIFIRILNGFLM